MSGRLGRRGAWLLALAAAAGLAAMAGATASGQPTASGASGLAPAPGSGTAAPAPDSRVIAAAVSSGGVDLSNLTVDAATAKLAALLGPRVVAGQLLVTAGGRRFPLTPATAGLRFDARATAQRAYDAGVARTPPGAGPGSAVVVAPVLSHARAAVRRFVARIARQVDRAPRDARVQITVHHIFERHSRPGHHVPQPRLARAVDAALDDPSAPRVIHLAVVRDPPKVTARGLARRHRAIVTVDRGHFRLRLFIHLRLAKSYPIAVGRVGLSTPRGLYHVAERQINPAWHVPNSSWAGALAGHTVPGGAAANPLKARWLGLGGGIGIHGTAEDFSIGSRASHGCIRMHVRDVIALYRRVPLGTSVLIR